MSQRVVHASKPSSVASQARHCATGARSLHHQRRSPVSVLATPVSPLSVYTELLKVSRHDGGGTP
eukprot:949429-Pyramimonas_sp.AAC.1